MLQITFYGNIDDDVIVECHDVDDYNVYNNLWKRECIKIVLDCLII